MPFIVRFMSVKGSPRTLTTEEFTDYATALAAVVAYVEPFGFTRVKLATDEDDMCDEMRITATTPGGRAGRNVATITDTSADAW